MDNHPRHFIRFLRAVHRRLVVIRAAERAGLGALVGCAAAGVLVLILLWRGEPALSAALVSMALGAAAGLLWGVAARPTLLHAAMEADRQFDLADLLGTALTIQHQQKTNIEHRTSNIECRSDPWQRTVLAIADQRCAALSPSSLVFNRLGARAWGGIGLAAALVLTLALLGSDPTISQARETGPENPPTRSPSALPAVPPANAVAGRDPDRAIQPRRAVDEETGPFIEPSHSAPGDEAVSADLPDGLNDAAGASDPAGTGSGAGRSNPADPNQPLTASATPAPSPPGREGDSHGAGGRSLQNPAPGGRVPPGATSADPRNTPPAPWLDPNWPADREAALQAVHRGNVPHAYRELIQAYFGANLDN